MSGPREVRAPRGPELHTRGWQQEGANRYYQCVKCRARLVERVAVYVASPVKAGWPNLIDSSGERLNCTGWVPEPEGGWPPEGAWRLPPVAQRLGDVDAPDALCAREIGDGSRHAQGSRVTSRGQPHGSRGLHQQCTPRLVRPGEGLQRIAFEFRIGARTASVRPAGLYRTGAGHAGADLAASLGRRRQGEVGGADRIDFDMQVDPIEQRP